MATYDFRILLETVEGRKTSYMSQSFVDTSVDLVLSASQVYSRITGSVSASYQNQLIFSQSATLSSNDINTNFKFKDNVLLSSSLQGSVITGSIDFDATTSEYDRLLRYKFFGEKVCNVLGLPHAQWVYVDQFSLNPDNDNNFFEGNVNAQNLFVGDSLTFANDSTINSDIPFLINTGSDRHIKFIDERDFGTRALIIGYDKDNDTYEVSGSNDKNFSIGGVDDIRFSDGTVQTSAGGGGAGVVAGSDTQVQFNDGGNFGGDSGLVFDKGTNLLTAGKITSTGDITANGNIVGDGATNISNINNITASGDISGSSTSDFTIGGTITSNGGSMTDNLTFAENKGIKFVDAGQGIIGDSTSITIDGDDTINIQADTLVDIKGGLTDGVNIDGNITASGDISSSVVSTISVGTGSFQKFITVGDSSAFNTGILVEASDSDVFYDGLEIKRKFPRIALTDTVGTDTSMYIWHLGDQLRFGSDAGGELNSV